MPPRRLLQCRRDHEPLQVRSFVTEDIAPAGGRRTSWTTSLMLLTDTPSFVAEALVCGRPHVT
jgi:hypothetical protein